jgi:hypothetical protein
VGIADLYTCGWSWSDEQESLGVLASFGVANGVVMLCSQILPKPALMPWLDHANKVS